MPGPHRVPVFQRYDRLTGLHLAALAALDVTYGATFLLGGKAESASQLLLKPILPPTLWGGLLVAAGAALWAGWNREGPIIGLCVWGGLASASAISIAQGTAQSYGGPWLFLWIAVFHAIVLWGEVSRRDDTRKTSRA